MVGTPGCRGVDGPIPQPLLMNEETCCLTSLPVSNALFDGALSEGSRQQHCVYGTPSGVPSSFTVTHIQTDRTTNPWLGRRPIVYAHQGGALEAPSSTMFAFRRALLLGCEAFEMDVHRTRDGVLVVAHDDTIDATTNRSGAIAELDWDELRTLDNAYWFVSEEGETRHRPSDAYAHRGRAPHDRAFGIARLEEVLDEFTDVFLNFDIKETSPTVHPYEEQLGALLRRYDRSTDVIVASFHDAALDEFRKHAPEIHTSLGPRDSLAVGFAIQGEGPEVELHPSVVALQLPTHFGRIEILTREFIDGAHQRHLAVHAWTIDDALDMERLLNDGVDGLISDRPSVACAVTRALR
jgi:glycerophosphoryl diester phosphodiesterase